MDYDKYEAACINQIEAALFFTGISYKILLTIKVAHEIG
jgi:hypothetical protein